MITQKIYEWSASQPARTAVIESNTVTSYASFAAMIESVRARLEPERLPAGKVAIVFAESFLEKWAMSLALRALGLDTLCVLSFTMVERLDLKNVGCIVATEAIIPELGAAPRDLGGTRLIRIPRETFEPAPSAAPLSPDFGGIPPGGYILCTSGTTGNYKKVFFRGAHEDEASRWTVNAFSFDRNTVFHGFNFPHWTGIGGRTAANVWFAGGCVIIDNRTERFRDYFRHRPTHGILVPAMVADLLQRRTDADPLEPGFELSVSGGFLPLTMAQEVVRRITPNIVALYGSTEVTALMRHKFEEPDDLYWLSEKDSSYQVVDEAGNECAADEEGEMRIRVREFDCQGYLHDTEATAKFYRNGFFYPGDLGVRRADGRVRVLGRTEDVLNIKGWKVPVAPIEERIGLRLGIETVCVFSEVDDAGEPEIVVVLESDRRPSERALSNAKADIRGFENARYVVLKSLPRTEAGMSKVNRLALRKQLR